MSTQRIIVLVIIISFIMLPALAIATYQGDGIPSYLEAWLVSNTLAAVSAFCVWLTSIVLGIDL